MEPCENVGVFLEDLHLFCIEDGFVPGIAESAIGEEGIVGQSWKNVTLQALNEIEGKSSIVVCDDCMEVPSCWVMLVGLR